MRSAPVRFVLAVILVLTVAAIAQTNVPASQAAQTSAPQAYSPQTLTPQSTSSPNAAMPAGVEAAGASPLASDTPSRERAVGPSATPDLRALQLGQGDLIEVKVFGVPDLTTESRVNSDGLIDLPLVGSVRVGQKTVEEAEHQIEQQLKSGGFLNNPHVTVSVKEYTTQGVSVLGEVQKPGIYPLMGVRRLFDAISAAGGMTTRAGRQVTITRRSTPDKPILVAIDSDPSKSPAGNVEIYPGDTVVVSKAGVVYVVGDVAHPSGFVMDNNEHMTVLEAIAMAGGTNSTAALNGAKIIRKTPSGPQEMPIALKKILAAQGQDLQLQPNDILFVPNSKVKGAAHRSAEAILSVVTGVAIYRR